MGRLLDTSMQLSSVESVGTQLLTDAEKFRSLAEMILAENPGATSTVVMDMMPDEQLTDSQRDERLAAVLNVTRKARGQASELTGADFSADLASNQDVEETISTEEIEAYMMSEGMITVIDAKFEVDGAGHTPNVPDARESGTRLISDGESAEDDVA